SLPLRSPRSSGRGVLADPDVIFKPLVGGVERFTDRHRQIGAGLTVNGNLGVWNAEGDADPEPAFLDLGPRRIDRDPALLDPLEEVTELLGPFLNMLGEAFVEETGVIYDLESDGHEHAPVRFSIGLLEWPGR